jgi:cation diffusion facilitator family transporter
VKAYERFHLHVQVDDAAEGRAAIAIAFIANVLVAAAKTVAAMITGSSSLRTEAVHSWVDVGNEGFVVAAARTARRGADERHPLGYGRASYVWSLFASLGMLLAGAVVGVWQGIRQLSDADVANQYLVGYIVIAVSFVLEGYSFLQTVHKVKKDAKEMGRELFHQAFRTSNSPMRAVFTEDFTALISLAIAALGMLLHQITGAAVYDATGSILIGVVMAIAALTLIARNGRYLSGETITAEQRGRVLASIRANPEIERITFVHAEFIGPDRLLLIAGVAINGERSQAELATVLRELERRMMEHKYVGLAILTLATPDEADIVQ